MSEIIQVSIDNGKRWNEYVRSFSNYDIFYLHEYSLAFMKEAPQNGVPILLYYENGDDRAINVVFKRDIALDERFNGIIEKEKYFDLISPYGYGGFWGNVHDYEALNKAYNDYCADKHYICEFVRFELFSDYCMHYDGEVITKTHNVIRNLEISLDEMWMDFKQKVRKNVKRANSFGLQIICENTGEHLQEFLDIYYSTMDRSNAESEYYFSNGFFEIIKSMKDNIAFFHVLYEDKIISTELVIFGAENCYSYLGGTNRDYFDLRPNDFLKYEVIKWAKEKGLKNYVLGGGYGSDDGIFQYKTCLAPKGIFDFYVGRKIFDNNNYQRFVEIRESKTPACRNSDFFPKYRAK